MSSLLIKELSTPWVVRFSDGCYQHTPFRRSPVLSYQWWFFSCVEIWRTGKSVHNFLITGRIQLNSGLHSLKMLPVCCRKYFVSFSIDAETDCAKSRFSIFVIKPESLCSFQVTRQIIAFVFSCVVNFVLTSRVTQSKQLQATIRTWLNCDKTWQHLSTVADHMLRRDYSVLSWANVFCHR